MLHLESKEYDLNMLLSFEMLKEILLKLSRAQDKLENEIKSINLSNAKRDNIIIKLEKSVFNTTTHSDNIQKAIDEKEKIAEQKDSYNYNKSENNIDKNNINEIQDKDLDNKNQNEMNINKNINYEKINEKRKNENEQNEQNIENNQKDESNINNQYFSPNKKVSDKQIVDYKLSGKSLNISQNDSKISGQSKKDKSSTLGVSPDIITKIMKQLKEQNSKLYILENQLKSESKNIKNVENLLKNHTLDNESQIKLINERIDSLLQKNEEYDQKIENLQVKASELDVFSIFRDNGDGTIDATKVMIKALEEKVFKKFELVDARYKKDSLDNLKLKTNMENITPKLDQFHRELERIGDINKQQIDDLDNYKKENEEKNLDNINNLNNDINQKILKLKEQIENDLKNKITSLENELKQIKKDKNDNNAFDLLKLGLGNNGLNSETAQALEKKINDLRKKTNDLENTLKLCMDTAQETDAIKKEIKDLKLLLEKKISKDDLKELYNFHLNDVDEINDIKDRESITNEELRKTIKDLQNIQQRIESISGNLALLQNHPTSGNTKIIDFSKYVDNQKLTDALKPFIKEFEKLYRELESIKKEINDIDSQNRNFTKNSLSKFDEDYNNKLNELKLFIQKRYLEKFDFNKTIKSIEVQIKSLNDEPKKNDADNWLLAKRPLKCFNCASCEANIKNDNYNTADYLPWKKYPRGEKIHRMGQGFSHMLQMMTSEFIKSLEKNEFPLDYESSAKNTNTNNNSNIFNSQFDRSTVTGGFIINNKEQIQEDALSLKKSKMKLPKVKQYSKPKIKKYEETLPISDDELIDNVVENNKELVVNSNSPQILKITKKAKHKIAEDKGNNTFRNLMTMQGGFTQRDKREKNLATFSRNNILKTEKNEFISNYNNSPKS